MTMAAAPEQAFDELLQRHRGIVFKVASTYAHGAEDRADLAQEIAAQLWRAWPGYDPALSFPTWMYRIALNVGISFLRGHAHRSRHAAPLDAAVEDIADERGFDPESVDRLRLLQRFIDTLDPFNRALLVLYLEEHSTREMAGILGIGESNVTTRISRLKQKLRDYASANGHH